MILLIEVDVCTNFLYDFQYKDWIYWPKLVACFGSDCVTTIRKLSIVTRYC